MTSNGQNYEHNNIIKMSSYCSKLFKKTFDCDITNLKIPLPLKQSTQLIPKITETIWCVCVCLQYLKNNFVGLTLQILEFL